MVDNRYGVNKCNIFVVATSNQLKSFTRDFTRDLGIPKKLHIFYMAFMLVSGSDL